MPSGWIIGHYERPCVAKTCRTELKRRSAGLHVFHWLDSFSAHGINHTGQWTIGFTCTFPRTILIDGNNFIRSLATFNSYFSLAVSALFFVTWVFKGMPGGRGRRSFRDTRIPVTLVSWFHCCFSVAADVHVQHVSRYLPSFRLCFTASLSTHPYEKEVCFIGLNVHLWCFKYKK